MKDKKPDALPKSIEAALKHVHEPPTTPREEIWQGIQAARKQRQIVPGHFAVPRVATAVVAAAAMLLIGFFIGRLWQDSDSSPDEPIRVVAPQQPDSLRNSRETIDVAANDSEVPSPADPAPSATKAASPAISQAHLRHAANHFNRSGVLLAQFAETMQDEEPLDPEFNKWARDLLTNTRLLLDSPLAADPQYEQLLGELEFTLAEIVQASAADDETEERQWVAGQLSDRSLVERLRLIVPALPGSRDI